jgi:hypothetical protein
VIVDKPPRQKPGRPKEQSTENLDRSLIYEVDAFKRLVSDEIRHLKDSEGLSIPSIASKLKLSTKEVERVLRGGEMTDKAGIYLRARHAKEIKFGHGDEVVQKQLAALNTRHSRAIKKYGRPLR